MVPYMVNEISKFQEKSSRLTRDGNIHSDPHDKELGKDYYLLQLPLNLLDLRVETEISTHK